MADVRSPVEWGLDRIDQRPAWGGGSFQAYNFFFTGAGAHVYVLDTGIEPVAQFGSRLSTGVSYSNDGTDPYDDCHGHGTAVASVAIGSVHGVATGATGHSVRVMDCNRLGDASNVIAGLDWIAANHTDPAVVNMSMSGDANTGFPYYNSVKDAMDDLINYDIVLIKGAGNDATDACSDDGNTVFRAVVVSASDQVDSRWGSANYGSCVDIFAPGTGVAYERVGVYAGQPYFSSTSIATPYVTGVAALIRQQEPFQSEGWLRQVLYESATLGVVSNTLGDANRLLNSIHRYVWIDDFTYFDQPGTRPIDAHSVGGDGQWTYVWEEQPLEGGPRTQVATGSVYYLEVPPGECYDKVLYLVGTSYGETVEHWRVYGVRTGTGEGCEA